MSSDDAKPISVKKLPLIINKNIIIKKGVNNFSRNIKLVKKLQNNIREEVIYASNAGDFTSGEARTMTIVHCSNASTKASRTIAKCQSHTGEFYEKTSEEITKLIGQQNYDILLSSLCSILNQELKVRSINSLLTVPKKSKSVSCQTDILEEKSFIIKKSVIDSSCQTHETCFENLKKFKVRKRNKRQHLAPYVVRDAPDSKKPKRVVISPDNFSMLFTKEKSVTRTESQTDEASLPDLGSVFDEDSNNSFGRLSSLSVTTTPELLANPYSILTNVDKHTRDLSTMVNEKEISVHSQYRLQNLGSPDSISPLHEKLPFGLKQQLHGVPANERIKLLLRQGLNDLQNCLNRDNDDHLPIHVAVLTNDEDLLRRQCIALKMKCTSVDVPADGLSPLRMSLFQENTQMTAVLLHFGADPLDTDEDDRTAFHIAAEMSSDHLQILVNHCQQNARKILHENEELWKPDYENKPDEELSPILMASINRLYDSQGYTPLMLASKLGKYNNVLALVESSRTTVNLVMPNSGNTALYLSVGAACMDAAERGNKTKVVDHFKKTVEILVENGADPNIENFAGSSVNDLLTEFNISELSMLIANKLTSIRYFDGQLPNGIKGSDFMLVKDTSGKVNIKELRDKTYKMPPKSQAKPKASPIILENVEYKPGKVDITSPVKSKTNIKVIPGLLPKYPGVVGTGIVSNLGKQENVNVTQSYTPIVKNFKLNKPIIIKSVNKRKLDVVADTNKSKKVNKID